MAVGVSKNSLASLVSGPKEGSMRPRQGQWNGNSRPGLGSGAHWGNKKTRDGQLGLASWLQVTDSKGLR